MSDLKRLDEALGDLDVGMKGPLSVVWSAARAFRDLLANGQRVEWCETHDSPQHGAREHCQAWYLPTTWDVEHWCRFVSKLLIDPPTEEERPWHTNYNTGERCYCALGGDPTTEEVTGE